MKDKKKSDLFVKKKAPIVPFFCIFRINGGTYNVGEQI